MTVGDFTDFVNGANVHGNNADNISLFKDFTPQEKAALLKDSHVQLPITESCAKNWLHRLGASFSQHCKALYYGTRSLPARSPHPPASPHLLLFFRVAPWSRLAPPGRIRSSCPLAHALCLPIVRMRFLPLAGPRTFKVRDESFNLVFFCFCFAWIDGHERANVVEHRIEFVSEMLGMFRRTYMWRSVLPSDPSVAHLRESGVHLTEIIDKHGVTWLEYCSDDVGECEERGELTKDHTVWISEDGLVLKPVIFYEQDEVIFKSNQDEFKSWVLPGMTPLRPKTEGAGLMISGFRSWEDGWMVISAAEKAALEVKLGRKFAYFYHWPVSEGGDDYVLFFS